MIRSTLSGSSFKRVSITSVRNIAGTTRRKLADQASRSTASSPHSSNPALSFPCLDKLQEKTDLLQTSQTLHFGLEDELDDTSLRTNELPEPVYSRVQSGFETFKSPEPLFLDYGGFLPEYQIAYEQWGTLNADKSNAILLHTGLSASSHAKSQPQNEKPGWWEKFIGPGKPLDTNKYFVVCTNVIGGCYGSTGPSSVDPADGGRYATRFPILSIGDMVRAQERLMRVQFGVTKLYASVGSSMGGMQSLAYAHEFPDAVQKVVSISGCARSHPYSIAMRHTQRQVLMSDPNWKRGFYYDSVPPHVGMKLAREIATVTYRSGPEWEMRFGRERANPTTSPALCPDFLVETYLDHQGNKFSLEYDPNSLLYVSKAMDLFDLGHSNRALAKEKRAATETAYTNGEYDSFMNGEVCSVPITEVKTIKRRTKTREQEEEDLLTGMAPIADKEVLVIGVKSDILFPHWQQQEIANKLRAGNIKFHNGDGSNIQHIELSEEVSLYGHDTFLLDLEHVGGAIEQFL